MSDTYAVGKYPRPNLPPLGMNRKKKYFRILLIVSLVAVAGLIYGAYSSGFFTDANPAIPREFFDRVNLERQASNLEPLAFSESLGGAALARSQDVRSSPMAYPAGATGKGGTNVFVVSKISWAVSSLGSRQDLLDTFENTDNTFRDNILNPAYTSIGIGVSSDAYNYYIVTMVH